MKKVLFLLGTMLAFIACGDKSIDMESPVADAQDDGFKVNITISREGDTKAAYVKKEFADSDVIFIKFKGVSTYRYLELRYNAAAADWTAKAKGGLTASDLEGAVTKQLTAVYLPYGKAVSANFTNGKYINCRYSDDYKPFLGNALFYYVGYYLNDINRDYTFTNGVLSANINLVMYDVCRSGYGRVHFSVTGYTPGHTYGVIGKAKLRPAFFCYLTPDGVEFESYYLSNNDITPCFEDNGNLTFSLEFRLDNDGELKSYGTFDELGITIVDFTDSIMYRQLFTDKTINDGDYIGLGNISSDLFSAWERSECDLSDPISASFYYW